MLTMLTSLMLAGLTPEGAATLAQRCPNGFADPDVYRHLSAQPDFSQYPVEALRRNLEGTVDMELIIGCDGVVKQCTIIRSSGHRVLDENACQTMARTAFSPPRDETGNPREARYTTSQTYRLR